MQGRPNLRRWPSQHLSSYEEVHVFIAHYDNNLQTPYLWIDQSVLFLRKRYENKANTYQLDVPGH